MAQSDAPSNPEVWSIVETLMGDFLAALRRIDALAPGFSDELYEARDTCQQGLAVADYLERLARHSVQHRNEISAIRASIGAARPTDPGDAHPVSEAPYAATWYRSFLLDAFLRRAELVSELLDLADGDLDRKPNPEHTAGNERSVREVCEHVMRAQEWILRGVEDGIRSWRESQAGERKDD